MVADPVVSGQFGSSAPWAAQKVAKMNADRKVVKVDIVSGRRLVFRLVPAAVFEEL